MVAYPPSVRPHHSSPAQSGVCGEQVFPAHQAQHEVQRLHYGTAQVSQFISLMAQYVNWIQLIFYHRLGGKQIGCPIFVEYLMIEI